MKYIHSIFLILIISIFPNSGCTRMIEVPAPVTSTNNENVYESDLTAIAVLTGIYTKFGSDFGSSFATGGKSISLFSGLSADEYELYSGVTNAKLFAYFQNSLNATVPDLGSEFWKELYRYLFICNSAIEGLSDSRSLKTTVRDELLGEAKFLRAFFIFLFSKSVW